MSAVVGVFEELQTAPGQVVPIGKLEEVNRREVSIERRVETLCDLSHPSITQVGLIFLAPVLGMAVGAVTGALGGRFADIGIDDAFIKEVGNTIEPGESALFMLVTDAQPDRVREELEPYNPEVLETNLSAEDEEKFCEHFAADEVAA